MNIMKMLEAISNYFAEGFARIFSHQEDEVPEIGVQPFECATYHEQSKA